VGEGRRVVSSYRGEGEEGIEGEARQGIAVLADWLPAQEDGVG